MPTEPVRATIHVEASPDRVWAFLTEPELITQWMGEYALLAAYAGGEFTVNVKGAPIRGRYLELDPPRRLVLSWGYSGSTELPSGASTVEIHLVPDGSGTRIDLEHRDLPSSQETGHVVGWRHYLARLSAAAVGDVRPDPGMPAVAAPPA